MVNGFNLWLNRLIISKNQSCAVVADARKWNAVFRPATAQFTNIAKGECRIKFKTKFLNLILPSRILYSQNMVKGGSKSKFRLCLS